MAGISDMVAPAVVAAVVSGAITIVSALVARSTALSTSKARLTADKELAEKRLAADMTLAERKAALDRAMETWRRRSAFAEEVLAEFYQAREIINSSRIPFSFGAEGSTRKRREGESEAESNALDAYFVTVERLEAHRELFAGLWSRRYRMRALLGPEAVKPLDELAQVRHEITVATRMLIGAWRSRQYRPVEGFETWEATVGWNAQDDDPIASRLEQAVQGMEAVCRPVIENLPTTGDMQTGGRAASAASIV